MKNTLKLLIVIIFITNHYSKAAENYPPVSKLHDISNDSFLQYCKEINSAAKDLCGEYEGFFERLKSSETIRSEFIKKADRYISKFPSQLLELHQAQGRMPLPKLFTHVEAFSSLVGDGPILEELAPTKEQSIAMSVFSLKTRMLIEIDAEKLLSNQADYNQVKGPDQYDMLLFKLCENYDTRRSANPLTKSSWNKLRQSKNSMLRMIALSNFKAFEHSPSELLALYKECMFNSCSFLEIRALEAIRTKKDFRTEVAQILKEYLDSGPVENDGTVPNTKVAFQNPIEAANVLLKIIDQHPPLQDPKSIENTTEPIVLNEVVNVKKAIPQKNSRKVVFPWGLIALATFLLAFLSAIRIARRFKKGSVRQVVKT